MPEARERHFFTTLTMLGSVLLLAACTARMDLWHRTTNDMRTFMALTQCNQNSAVQISRVERFYQVTNIQSVGRADQFGRTLTFINESGAPVSRNIWIMHRSDMLPFSLGMSNKFPVPSWFPWPASPAGQTCADIVTVPWQGDRNRPYWVADETLRMSPQVLAETSTSKSLVILGLFVAFAVGTVFVGIGYYDDNGSRRRGVTRSGLIGAAAIILLMIVRSNMIDEPAERLPQIQAYYTSYDQLPKAGGYLMPISGAKASMLFDGPPITTDLLQNTAPFTAIAWLSLLLWILFSAKRLYMGLYWTFVQHPAEPLVGLALQAGKPIDGIALAHTLNEGALDTGVKSTFHYKQQAEKARVLREKLDADADIAEATIRRERARGALEDAERDIQEVKKRGRKKS
jgi:hypothetical protein